MEKRGNITNKTMCECGSGKTVKRIKKAEDGSLVYYCSDCQKENRKVHETPVSE